MIDTIWYKWVLLASPHWTSQIRYETVASLLLTLDEWAVQMSLYRIADDYNGPLEAAHVRIDDDRYDLVKCGAACQPTLDLSDQIRDCSIATTHASRLSNTNELV